MRNVEKQKEDFPNVGSEPHIVNFLDSYGTSNFRLTHAHYAQERKIHQNEHPASDQNDAHLTFYKIDLSWFFGGQNFKI